MKRYDRFMIGSVSGIVGVALAIALVFRPRDSRLLHAFMICVATVPILAISCVLFSAFSASSQVRYDQFFYLIEQNLGAPSYFLGEFLATHRWLLPLVLADYRFFLDAVVLTIILVFLKGGVRDGYRAFLRVLSAAVVLPVCYKVFPASGPSFAFAGFPFTHPAIATPHVVYLTAPPNCFPSGHLVMALLCFFLLFQWPVLRIFAALHVGLTILATLGLGEHYAIDLMAALPYVAVVLRVRVPSARIVSFFAETTNDQPVAD